MPIATVYDFESAIEPAIKTILEAQSLTCLTSRDALTFEKAVPRVEIVYLHGPGLKKWADLQTLIDAGLVPVGLTPNQYWQMRRESAWQSQLNLNAITKADVAVHANYRAKVRAVLASCWQFINGFSITTHMLNFDNEGGNSPIYKPQDGFFGTTISYPVKVSVQADAWSALSS